ncbi:MAG: pyridoxal phosphate-dependent aminotransferase [Deltaproteobacteria bacterium]|nr:pyridoxal phosphate-dependent aminotransferase [Deltaproteobacteria bacterium]
MVSKTAQRVKPFLAMEVMDEIQRLRQKADDVISFSVGEPDLPPPDCVKEACIQAIREDFTKYTHSQGLLELRQAICDHYAKRYGVSITPDRVLVTEGTSPALFLLFAVLLEAGDQVILTNPCYPCYPNTVRFFRGKPVFVPVREEEGFQYRTKDIQKKITKRTKGILINSPSNPTGHLISETTLREIASLKTTIISDEIYHGLVYQGRERSILEFTDNAFVLNGFSKAYAMTGFRLGYLIAPKKFIRPMQVLHQNFYISANSFVQRAGIAALKKGGADQEKMRQIFARRQQVMLEGVARLGLKVAKPPEGAFYVFANAKQFTNDSYRFAFDLLKKTHVGVTPGIDFGTRGEGFLRFSYAVPEKTIREGLRRVGDYLKKYG